MLSKRQKELFVLLLNGLSEKRATKAMGIASGTLKYHRNVLYRKLGITSRSDMIRKYLRFSDEAEELLR